MISPRKLMAMARKWQKMAGIGRRREISLPNARNTRLADKGHFVVYSMDKRRFMVPLAYLSSSIFIELLSMSEEEFGLPGDGPITLPFDAATMEYMVSMVGRHVSEELEKALLVSLANTTSLCFATASVYGGLRSRIIVQGL